jgi:hypothetical protein
MGPADLKILTTSSKDNGARQYEAAKGRAAVQQGQQQRGPARYSRSGHPTNVRNPFE